MVKGNKSRGVSSSFERRLQKVEKEERVLKNENKTIKEYLYILTGIVGVLFIGYFILLKLTGFAFLDFSAGSLVNVVSEGNFSHVTIGTDAPYSQSGYGLVAYYSFDGDASDVNYQTGYGVKDYTSNANDGVITGGVTMVDGIYGNAASFDGASGQIAFGSTGLPVGTSSRTISLWVKRASTAEGAFVTYGDASGSGTQFGVSTISGGKLFVWGNNVDFTGSTTLAVGQWYHVVVEFDGTTFNAFLNGQSEGSQALAFNTVLGTPTMGNNGQAGYFNGLMDEVMIFNHALSAQQVSDIYNNVSSRLVSNQGNHTLSSVDVGRNDTANITLGYYSTPAGTNISVQIGSGAVANFVNGVVNNYAVLNGGGAVKLIYNTDGNRMFSPVAGANITVDSWRVAAVDTTAPTISFESPTSSSVLVGSPAYVNLTTTDSSQHYSLVDLDDSLIGWWRLEGGVSDDKGDYNATWVGNESYSVGKFGNSTTFSDASYINGSSDSVFNMLNSSAWSFWMKSSDAGDRPIIITKVDGSIQPTAGWYIKTSGTQLVFGGCNNAERPVSFVPDGIWHHVVITKDNSNVYFYIDGSLAGSGACTIMTAQSNNASLKFGHNPAFNGNWAGSLDDIMFFNRSLSTAEVSSLYSAGTTQYYNNFTGLATGVHTITGYAVDIEGNKGSTTSSIEVGSWQVNVSVNSSYVLGEQYSFVNFDNSLVGWWRGEGDALDELGRYNGTLSGNANASSVGKFNSSFGLDGNGDYVSISDPELENFTVSGWINLAGSTGVIQTPISMEDLINKPFRIDVSVGGNLYLNVVSSQTYIIGSTPISTGTWYFVTAIREGSNNSFYINGQHVGSSTAGDAISTTPGSEGFIGCRHYEGAQAYWFNGRVDDITLFNRVLSTSEILSLYNSTANQYTNNFTTVNGTSYSITGYAVNSLGSKFTNTTTVTAPSAVLLTLGSAVVSDSTTPLIAYGLGTENFNEFRENSSGIYVNSTWIETNLANITFSLYTNGGTLVNATTFTSSTYEINWTGLNAGMYRYQVNITDTANNANATAVRNITLLGNCLNAMGSQCIEGQDCNITNLCYMYSSLCSNNVCDFGNLRLNGTIYTLYDNSGNGNELFLNASNITFIKSTVGNRGNYTQGIVFNGKVGSTISPGTAGGNASRVNVTVPYFFNTTRANFTGLGGYSTLSGSVGGNGGLLYLQFFGLIRKFTDNNFAGANNALRLTTGGSVDSGTGAAGEATYGKVINCGYYGKTDVDITDDGLVGVSDKSTIIGTYNNVTGDNTFSSEYDISCDGKLNVIEISKIGFQYNAR